MFHASDGWPQPLTLFQLMPPGLDPGRALELGRQGKSPAGRSGQRGQWFPQKLAGNIWEFKRA